MNRTRLLMIGFVALALAAFVSFTVYRRLNAPGAANVPPGDNIIIAAANISLGAKIEDKDVKVVQLPAADLPPRHFRQKSQVLGRGVIVPIAQGEFVLSEKLAGENAGSGLPALIPTGMRAVSVRVNEVIGVAGFVVPGTRVDVLLTGSPSGSGGERTTTVRSEEHTSELQSQSNLVCRLLLEKKKKRKSHPSIGSRQRPNTDVS